MEFIKKWKKNRDEKRQYRDLIHKEHTRQKLGIEYQQNRKRRFPTIDLQPLPGCVQIQYSVVGESYRKSKIASIGIPNPTYKLDKGSLYEKGLVEKKVYAYTFPSVVATLEPEPTNQYDPNAVKVIANGVHVGYIKATEASVVKRMVEEKMIRRTQCDINFGDYCILHADDKYFDAEVPMSEFRIKRGTIDFSVTIFIDVPEKPKHETKKKAE